MLGELLAVGGNLLSGFLNNQAAAARQNDAQDFNAQQFATRYQTTVADMQKAGLNPMLAYSQGGGSGASSSPAGSSGYSDLGATINNARVSSASIANTMADTANKEATKALIDAQVGATNASADQSRSQSNLADNMANEIAARLEADQPKLEARIKQLQGDELVQRLRANLPLEQAEQLAAATLELQAQANLLRQKGFSEIKSREVMQATIEKMVVDNRLTDVKRLIAEQDERAGASFGELGKTVGSLEPFLRLLWNAFRR